MQIPHIDVHLVELSLAKVTSISLSSLALVKCGYRKSRKYLKQVIPVRYLLYNKWVRYTNLLLFRYPTILI